MTWKQFFGFTTAKLIVFAILVVLMNSIPTAGMCADGVGFGYCITYHGLPFPSFIITGELSGIPSDHWARIITGGVIGFFANLVIAYLILSVIFFAYAKMKKE